MQTHLLSNRTPALDAVAAFFYQHCILQLHEADRGSALARWPTKNQIQQEATEKGLTYSAAHSLATQRSLDHLAQESQTLQNVESLAKLTTLIGLLAHKR